MFRSGAPIACAAWLAVLAGMGGCSRQITVLHFPEFNIDPIQKVAVVPFVNQTYRPRAGEVVAGRLAEALRANGTYEVLGPRERRRVKGSRPPLVPPAGRDCPCPC